MFGSINLPAILPGRQHSTPMPLFSSLLCAALFCGALAPQAARSQAPLRPIFRNRAFRRPAAAAGLFPLSRPAAPGPTDRVLVKLKAGVAPADFVQRFNTALARSVPTKPDALAQAGVAAALTAPTLTYKHTNKLGWSVIQVSDPNAVNNVVALLARQPEVRLAQPDHRVKLLFAPPTLAAPNDTYWGPADQPWQDWLGLLNVLNQFDMDFISATNDDDSYWTYNWALVAVNAVNGWSIFPGKYYTPADRMNSNNYLPLIGDIDTGADLTHPDFSYTGNPAGAQAGPPPLWTTLLQNDGLPQSNIYVYYAALGGLPETDPFDPDPTLVNPDPTVLDYTMPGSATYDTDVSHGGQLNIGLARSFIDGEYNLDANGNPDYVNSSYVYAIDGFGHGTTTAGIIAAAANKGYGIPGLAYCSQLVPLKAVDNTGNGYESNIEDAMMYAADIGCIAINMSLDIGTTDYSQALQDAVDYCWTSGTLVVAAAGNDNVATSPILGETKQWPANCDKVLTVAACTYNFNGLDANPLNPAVAAAPTVNGQVAASYSDYGPEIGVAAPGGDITVFAVDTSTDFESSFGLGLGTPGQEYVFPFVLAPTYLTALGDPSNPEGTYAANNLYGVLWSPAGTTGGVDQYGPTAITSNYGIIQGTSIACPHVTALAALYAAKNNITQATPNACQLLINAIERGAAVPQGSLGQEAPLNGGLLPGGGNTLGYGIIDAAATLQDSNARNATVGGLVGQVKLGDTVQGYLKVTAVQAKNGVALAHGRTYTTTSGPDGIYRIPNLVASTGPTAAFNGYNVSCSISYINDKGRVAKLTVTVKNVKVLAGCNQMGIDILFE